MILNPQLHEISHVYDTGGLYLYRITWSSEKGYFALQRRLKEIEGMHPNGPQWPKSSYVENYLQTHEFYPYPAARPIMKFSTKESAEKVILDDTDIAGIKPKRKVIPR